MMMKADRKKTGKHIDRGCIDKFTNTQRDRQTDRESIEVVFQWAI